ncbi:MAG: TRAP transporter small permease subunit [Epsilonproteobacteria bacterium]|nr:TRAP transporter small permease subunit [Campylobacterota bacterium]
MKKAIDLTILILSKFTALALSVLILLIVYDATMRYLFSEGSTALQELEWHLFDVVILLSIAYTLKMNSHVRVDILYDKFPKKIQKYIDIIAIVFFILPFSFFIIYVSYDFVAMSLLQNEASSDPGGLPYRWIVKSLILIAFFMLALQSVRNLIEDIKELKKW